jgi:hypothetical protein
MSQSLINTRTFNSTLTQIFKNITELLAKSVARTAALFVILETEEGQEKNALWFNMDAKYSRSEQLQVIAEVLAENHKETPVAIYFLEMSSQGLDEIVVMGRTIDGRTNKISQPYTIEGERFKLAGKPAISRSATTSTPHRQLGEFYESYADRVGATAWMKNFE